MNDERGWIEAGSWTWTANEGREREHKKPEEEKRAQESNNENFHMKVLEARFSLG